MSRRTTVILTNPFSGSIGERDFADLTQAQLDAYAVLMDDSQREAIHSAFAPCSPGEFLAAWAEAVGPEEAGRVILGS